MQVVPRPFLYFAILLLAVGFSFMADVSDTALRHDQVKVRCACQPTIPATSSGM